MTKVKNKSIHSNDTGYLKYLAEEFKFIGRPYRLNLKEGSITQIARAPKKKSKKEKEKAPRNKRAESAERNAK